MAKQTITLRLDEDDLAYLAQAEVPGATNLSEKLRGLLAEARAQRDGRADFGAAYDFSRRLYGPPERCVRDAEVREGVRSELVARVFGWLPDATAFVLSGADADLDRAGLARFERALGERTLGLVDSVLQLAHAGFPGCYAPAELFDRASAALATVRDHPGPQGRNPWCESP